MTKENMSGPPGSCPGEEHSLQTDSQGEDPGTEQCEDTRVLPQSQGSSKNNKGASSGEYKEAMQELIKSMNLLILRQVIS